MGLGPDFNWRAGLAGCAVSSPSSSESTQVILCAFKLWQSARHAASRVVVVPTPGLTSAAVIFVDQMIYKLQMSHMDSRIYSAFDGVSNEIYFHATE
jgi:hypothetical protein